jgi:hypothetical protein
MQSLGRRFPGNQDFFSGVRDWVDFLRSGFFRQKDETSLPFEVL